MAYITSGLINKLNNKITASEMNVSEMTIKKVQIDNLKDKGTILKKADVTKTSAHLVTPFKFNFDFDN